MTDNYPHKPSLDVFPPVKLWLAVRFFPLKKRQSWRFRKSENLNQAP
jgi:hypothetical protein